MRAMMVACVLLATTAIFGQERPRLTLDDAGELYLRRRDANELEGSFRDRSGRTAHFRSTSSPDGETASFSLLDWRGERIIALQADREIVRVWILGMTAEAKRNETRLAFEVKGNDAALEELRSSEAYAVLPRLAIELYLQKINGEGFPAARFLHGIAYASAAAQGFEMPDIGEPAPSDEVRPVSYSLTASCKSLRNPKDPYQDQCNGMCGNECTCWWPVCGNCCACRGCYTHDWSCRVLACGGNLADKVGCYTFASFFLAYPPCETYGPPPLPGPCDRR